MYIPEKNRRCDRLVQIYMYVSPTQKFIANQTLMRPDVHAASHTIMLGTPVSEFYDTTKQRVNLMDRDLSYRSLCVILKTVCLGVQASASNFNGCLFAK